MSSPYRPTIYVYKEDKPFFVENEELNKYLIFKYRVPIKTQEDIMKLLKIEIEEILKKGKITKG